MNYSKDANTKKQKTKKATKKKVENRIGIIIIRVLIIGIILMFFAIIGAFMGAYLGVLDRAPDVDLILVEPTKYTSYIYDQNGVELDSLHGNENRDYIEISQMPLNIINATVAVEDERFYSHNGVDFKGMIRALFVNAESKLSGKSSLEGASTITQQLIKHAFFEEALTGKEQNKLTRKLQEQYMAIQLENKTIEKAGNKKLAKDLILELYINTINYHGAYGIQAAAKRYFAKDASELTLAESAVLAAIPQSPTKWNPITHPENNKERQTTVLNRMLNQGYISQSEYDSAISEDVYAKIQTLAQEVAEKKSSHSYYIDALIEQLIEHLMEQKGFSEIQASNYVFNSGLRIYANIDLEMQAIIDEAYTNPNFFPKNDFTLEAVYKLSVKDKVTQKQIHYNERNYVPTQEAAEAFAQSVKAKYLTDDVEFVADKLEVTIQPQSAFIITDYHTGEVKALIGGRGEKTESRTFNRATQAKRQPGSTFKVLAAYAPGIDLGLFTTATMFNDAPYTKGNWSPGNWYSGYKGWNTIRAGIANSMNILAAKAISQLGVNTSIDYLKNLGITTMVDAPELRADGRTYSDLNDTVALGGITDGVILSELNSAFGTIANKGQYLKPMYYTKVVDRKGQTILENTYESKTVLKESTAYLLTDMMKDVVTSSIGTGKTAKFQRIKMPVVGKTGTTSDVKDLLFAGYTPYYVGSIWLGFDQSRNLKDNANTHVTLWREIMEKIHEVKGLEYKEFERPESIIEGSICALSGKLPVRGLCDSDYSSGSRVITDLFDIETYPTEQCENHVRIRIDKTTNMLANQYCPSDYVINAARVVRTDNDNYSELLEEAASYVPTQYCTAHNANTIYVPKETTTSSSTASTTETKETDQIPVPPVFVPEETTTTQPNTVTPTTTQSTTIAPTTTAPTTIGNVEIPTNDRKLDVAPTIDDFLLP